MPSLKRIEDQNIFRANPGKFWKYVSVISTLSTYALFLSRQLSDFLISLYQLHQIFLSKISSKSVQSKGWSISQNNYCLYVLQCDLLEETADKSSNINEVIRSVLNFFFFFFSHKLVF